jgi:hypothetical protein
MDIMKAADRIRFGRYTPRPTTREGRMLSAGTLTATITSRRSGRHVTLRFRAKRNDAGKGKWVSVPFEEATHVFISSFDGEKLATYYTRDGMLRFEANVSEAVRWSVQSVLRRCADAFPGFEFQAELAVADLCGRCAHPLTDPESLERGLGPECFGIATSSRHEDLRAAA